MHCCAEATGDSLPPVRWRATAPASWSDVRRRARGAARALLDPPTQPAAAPSVPLSAAAPPPSPAAAEAPADPYAGQRLHVRRWIDPAMREELQLTGQRRLLVLHVPKTAGTSLRLMLAAHVPKEQTYLGTGTHGWVGRSIADQHDYTLFAGHTFLEPLYLFPDDDWVTALTVREPVSWWRSYYRFRVKELTAVGRDDHPMVRLGMGGWMDSVGDGALANPQTSWLLARTRLMFDSAFSPEPTVVAASGDALRHRPELVVALQDRLLEAITVVGTTADVQAVYLGICRAMRWEPVHASATVENVSRGDAAAAELTAGQEQRLRDVNRLDQRLYERAGSLAGPG